MRLLASRSLLVLGVVTGILDLVSLAGKAVGVFDVLPPGYLAALAVLFLAPHLTYVSLHGGGPYRPMLLRARSAWWGIRGVPVLIANGEETRTLRMHPERRYRFEADSLRGGEVGNRVIFTTPAGYILEDHQPERTYPRWLIEQHLTPRGSTFTIDLTNLRAELLSFTLAPANITGDTKWTLVDDKPRAIGDGLTQIRRGNLTRN